MTNGPTVNVNREPEATAVARIVERHIQPTMLELEGPGGAKTPVLVLPQGLQAHSVKEYLDEYRTAPERREGTATFTELLSLVEHTNRFKDADSTLWANSGEASASLTAVLDYHRKGPDGLPRFGLHRGLYEFPFSEEWKAWTAKNGAWMEQAAFAQFLEDRIQDVADPDSAFASTRKFAEQLGGISFASPSRLLELSRGLTVHVDERVTNKVDLGSGETTMHFETQHTEGGGPLKVPRAFLVQLPVFHAGQSYQLAVRLRYRAANGRVSWSYDIHGAKRAKDDAFREACEEASDKTELPLFFGAPESDDAV